MRNVEERLQSFASHAVQACGVAKANPATRITHFVCRSKIGRRADRPGHS